MGKYFLKTIGIVLVSLFAYLLFWPVPIDPVSWVGPKTKGYTGDFIANSKLDDIERIALDGHHGPEDVAVGGDGLVYTATLGGDILSVDLKTKQVIKIANTGGRALGIEFGADGVIYIADAYRGLLKLDNDGKIIVLANKTQDGSPIKYADDLDVTKSGVVYFSDASTKFGAQEYKGTLEGSLLDLMEHGPNGRILKYDPVMRKTSVVLDGLSFANGVALANDESYFLFTETGTYSVHKYWLTGEKSDQVETILENLPGFPDNINNNEDGTFWFGIVSPRSAPMDALGGYPFLRKVVQRLPSFIRPKPQRYGFVVRIDGEGQVIETLQDPSGKFALTTGAVDGPGGKVLISSLVENAIGIWVKP